MKEIKDHLVEYLIALAILLTGMIIICFILCTDLRRQIAKGEKEKAELQDSIKILNEYLEYD